MAFFRCDVKWFGTKTTSPSICEPFFARDPSKTLAIMLETALGHFQQGNSDAALVS